MIALRTRTPVRCAAQHRGTSAEPGGGLDVRIRPRSAAEAAILDPVVAFLAGDGSLARGVLIPGMIRTVRILTDQVARRLARDDAEHGVLDRLRFQLELRLSRRAPQPRRLQPSLLRPQRV